MSVTFLPAYTFDDVTLVPKKSNIVSRKDISLSTNVTKNIKLNTPFISSCMDTVTGAEMAIEMARNGGLGIVHRFCSIEEQVNMVKKVKRAQAWIINDPYTIDLNETIGELREQMYEKQVGSFLVVNKYEPRILIGIITERDIRYQDDNSKVRDLMTPLTDSSTNNTNSRKLITASPGISIEKAKEILRQYRIKKLPIIENIDRNHCNDCSTYGQTNNVIRGLICSKDIHEKLERPFASLDTKGRLLVGAAIGIVDDYIIRASQLVKAETDIIVIDTANGHNQQTIDVTRYIKKTYPQIDVISGNVSSLQGFKDLVEAGADGIRVGIGNASICSTRIVTGFGVPLLTTILECKEYSKQSGVPIISDGGTSGVSGKMVKALAAGAGALMLGSTLAGTDEAPGEKINRNGKAMKHFRGMAGYAANISKRQKLSKDGKYTISGFIPEGVEAFVEYKGPVKSILDQLIGGVKSGISYIGSSITDLQDKAEFRLITYAGQREGAIHDVKLD